MGLDFLRDFIFIGESVPLHMNQKRKKKKRSHYMVASTHTDNCYSGPSIQFLLCLQLRRSASGLVTAAK